MATEQEMNEVLELEEQAMVYRFQGDESAAEAVDACANAMRQAIWARLSEVA